MSTRTLRFVALTAALSILASCAPRPAPPAPAPPPPAPPPTPPAPPPSQPGWEDRPASAGDWSYRADGSGSAAAFGAAQVPLFIVRCDASRQVSLVRTGAAGGQRLTIRTTYGERTLAATPQSGGLTATLSPADPLLDWIAFSRGRIAVEADGTPGLILPAWPETARVTEDCRG
ncbi:MAG: hypothetical protein ACXWUX_08365 [Allosphingosinicella sp.]